MGIDEIVPIFRRIQLPGPFLEHVVEVLLSHRYREEFLTGQSAARSQSVKILLGLAMNLCVLLADRLPIFEPNDRSKAAPTTPVGGLL